ncbi:MAG: TetR/AcrR family transcriptional regulator C-terminal domain-containing protein [Agathobacter sp.]|nr:TetR/AcrR family transcriptional regulator C-terminal domain-containing protein [Agathobacter sp.]
MGEKREYRSSIRSRKLIRQAFYETLKEKSFEKITVTDIVKKADINRSTFYAHYPDVMGLIDEIQEEVLDYTQKFMGEIDFSDFFENPKPYLQNIVKLVAENNELYRLLMTSAMAAKQLDQLKYILIERTITTLNPPEMFRTSFEMEFAVRFFMGGIVDVYTQWLNGVIDCTLDELTDELAKMVIRSNKHLREGMLNETDAV